MKKLNVFKKEINNGTRTINMTVFTNKKNITLNKNEKLVEEFADSPNHIYKAEFLEKQTTILKYVLESAVSKRKLYTTDKIGSGRYSTYSVDHTKKYCEILELYGFKYVTGNDAPKGGQLGNYIQVV